MLLALKDTIPWFSLSLSSRSLYILFLPCLPPTPSPLLFYKQDFLDSNVFGLLPLKEVNRRKKLPLGQLAELFLSKSEALEDFSYWDDRLLNGNQGSFMDRLLWQWHREKELSCREPHSLHCQIIGWNLLSEITSNLSTSFKNRRKIAEKKAKLNASAWVTDASRDC